MKKNIFSLCYAENSLLTNVKNKEGSALMEKKIAKKNAFFHKFKKAFFQ